MTDKEIKEIYRRFELDMYPTMPDELSAKSMLEWLSDRYCIVCKDVIRDMWKMAKEAEPRVRWDDYDRGQCEATIDTLEELFPDLLTDKDGKQ